MQVRKIISQADLGSEFRVKATLFLIVTAFCLILGFTTALWHPLLSIGLIAGPLALLLLMKYPEVGLMFYATCLSVIDPLCDFLNIPTGYRALPVGILLTVALILFVIRKRGKVTAISGIQIAALCLGLVLFLGLMWTPSPKYGQFKAEAYILFNLLLLLGASLLGGEVLKLKRTVYVAAFFGVIFCFWGLTAVLTQQPEVWRRVALRLAMGAFDAIWLARSLGIFVISLVILAQITKTPIAKAFMWALAAALVFLMFYTGSREPVYGLLLTLLFYLLFLSKMPLWKGTLLAIIGGVTLYAIFSIVPPAAQSRILEPINPATTERAFLIRQQIWQVSVDIFRSHPIIGVGTGGYSYHFLGSDIRAYSHNIFLEIACELGILGIIPLLAFVFASLRIAASIFPKGEGINSENFPAVWSISIFIFALIGCLISGDICANTILWFSAGFMWATYVTFKKTK